MNKDIRIKIRFNRKIVNFLFEVITNQESLTFLQELRRLFVLTRRIQEDNYILKDDYILNMIVDRVIAFL